MGGSIPLSVRFNNGETVCIDCWTNLLPAAVMNNTTLSGNDSIIRKLVMDVVSHEAYEGPQPFREYGYGMVAIDFISRQIHSKQGYTTFNQKTIIQLIDINASGWRQKIEGKEGPEYIRLQDMIGPPDNLEFKYVISEEGKSLIDAGRISIHNSDNDNVINIESYDQYLNILYEDLKSENGLKSYAYHSDYILVDTAPFEVFDYDETGSLASMKANLRKHSYPLTQKEGLNEIFSNKRR